MHDLVIQSGHVIDPANGLDGIADVGFNDSKVAAVGAGLEGRNILDASGKFVVPGLIDLHTHVYWGGTSIGVDPDTVAKSGAVATLVDAGTAGPANMAGFRRHVIETSRARVLPFINLSFPGIFAFSKRVMVGECADLRLLDARECVRVAREHADIVVGVKVRVGLVAGGQSGIAPLDIAIEVAEELDLPVMAHLDYPPPSRLDVVKRLRSGDILTHCFRPFPNAPATASGAVREECLEARSRGVIFDVGHGMGSFGFKTARAMLASDFVPDVISSDVHCLSIDGPAFDLLTTMSKFLCLGLPLTEVIACATRNPAAALGKPELGSFSPGTPGDASILELQSGHYEFKDSLDETVMGEQRLACAGLVLGGDVIDTAK